MGGLDVKAGKRWLVIVKDVGLRPEEDLRRIGPVARVSQEWKAWYSKRSSVERVNSRLKETGRLERHRLRRLKKITAHCLLSAIVIQATAVVEAHAGSLAELRACVREVA